MLRSLRNVIDYPLRQFFHWRRSGLRFNNEPKDAVYADLPEEERRQAEAQTTRFVQTYRLEKFARNSTARNFRENLFYLEMLEGALERAMPDLPEQLCVADVGTSHWFYVQALYALLCWWHSPNKRKVRLYGYEADAYRVYADFHSRYDHAIAHINDLSEVVFIPKPFQRQASTYDVITLLFPFVFLRDHLEWGLPRGNFDTVHLLEDVWNSVKPGGLLVMVNQGAEECKVLHELCEGSQIAVQSTWKHASVLYEYELERFVSTAVRSV